MRVRTSCPWQRLYSAFVNVELLKTLPSLQPVLANWRELAGGMPFRQPEWLLAWWQYFKSEADELFVLVVRDDEGRVRAIAPWYRDTRRKTVRFLGDGRVCTDHCTVLIDHRFSDEPIPAAIVAKLRALAGAQDGWTMLHFEAIDCHDAVMDAFTREMRQLGAKVHRSHYANTWLVDLPEGWDKFIEGLSRKSRKTLRNRANKLEKVEVRWVHSQSDFDAFMPVLVDLHQKRRNAVGDAGCFADPRFQPFLRQAAARLLSCGQLQAFSLWLEGRPIAADIGFRSHNRWLCYQAGIDPDMMEHEPGKLANIHILRNAEAFGMTTVDFLRGDEPYKQQLKADPHPVCDLRFTAPGIAGSLRHTWWQAQAKARSGFTMLKRRLMPVIARKAPIGHETSN
jgi:CelD/BcsL family acetyltransferase involved in cellulose biosynthesis